MSNQKKRKIINPKKSIFLPGHEREVTWKMGVGVIAGVNVGVIKFSTEINDLVFADETRVTEFGLSTLYMGWKLAEENKKDSEKETSDVIVGLDGKPAEK